MSTVSTFSGFHLELDLDGFVVFDDDVLFDRLAVGALKRLLGAAG